MSLTDNVIRNVRDVPIIGPWVGKIGKIHSILSLPCGPSTDIWVTAAWIESPKLFWSIFAPDCLDAAANRGKGPPRKGAGNQRGAHRLSRRGRARGMRVVDPTSWIGNAANQVPIPKGALSTALFRIFGVSQATAFYFFIADAGLDFLINWTSLAMKAAGCDQAGFQIAKAHLPADTYDAPVGDWTPVFWQETVHNDAVQFTNHIRISGFGSYALALNWQIKKKEGFLPDDQPVVRSRVRDDTTGYVYEEEGEVQPLDLNTASVATLTLIPSAFGGLLDLVPELDTQGGWIEISGSTVAVIPLDGILETLSKSPCIPQPAEWPTQFLPLKDAITGQPE